MSRLAQLLCQGVKFRDYPIESKYSIFTVRPPVRLAPDEGVSMDDVNHNKKGMGMNYRVALLGFALLASGCSTMTPARYSVSIDNNQVLKTYAGSKVKVASVAATGNYDANCRLMGPIQASDGMTIPQFVGHAFNEELKFANIYSDSGVTLNGDLTKIAFSSSAGLTNGWWDLALSLTSSNGKSMDVESRYAFKSGFDAITACNQTAQALGAAVQDLIKRTVSDPRFAALIH